MKTNIYSVLDLKTGVFCTPFFMLTDEAAIRDFSHAASDLNTTVGRHPADFTLYRIGSFQDVTGLITTEPSLVPLGVAAAFKSSIGE